jgi:2-polyprenyl-6-hydroxyphenyl methylase/3-demethylubiquinone-9 3-methyltransferase
MPYPHHGADRPGYGHAYLLPVIDSIVSDYAPDRIFDLGCGNGTIANHLSRHAHVDGVDPAPEMANAHFPQLNISQGSAYDDLASRFGTYPMVVAIEVIEHLYSPRAFAKTVHDLLEPEGVAVISTPYHGYLKNLGLALAGRMDHHFQPLNEHGHIKFWSTRTLTRLLTDTGFDGPTFHYAGRLPWLAKSMIAVAIKSSEDR